MELKDMTDVQLSDHLNAVLAEQERRAAQAMIPAQIAEMSARFTAGGGDVATLKEALVTGSE